MPRILLAVLWPATFLLLSQETNAPSKLRPPVTPRHDVTEVLHGVSVTDPYRWLEDQNSPETRKWIDAQNAYTHAFLDRWPGREAIEKRLTQLQKVEVIQSPIERAGRFFFRKRSPDQEQSVIHQRRYCGRLQGWQGPGLPHPPGRQGRIGGSLVRRRRAA
jgi:prolyl oligopeptidase